MRLLIIALFLSSCAQMPEYQMAKANGTHRNGWTETKITKTKYLVNYLDLDAQKSTKGLMRRAYELAVENNKTSFCINDLKIIQENVMVNLGGGVTKNWGMFDSSATVELSNKDSSNCTLAREFAETLKLPNT